MASKKELPKQLYIYVGDRDTDGTPILYTATDINDIDESTEWVGLYDRIDVRQLVVGRSLV